MSTNVLPQALFMVPRNGTERGLTKLRCAALVSGRPSSLCSSVSLHSTGFFSGSFKGLRDIVVVRAEENSAEAEVENVGSEEPVEGAEAEEEEVVETEDRPPRTPRIKLGDIMGILNKRAIEESDTVRPTPDIRTGDIVEIKLEVPENRRRLSIYKGIVMSKQNAGIHTTIRIRRIIAGIGVEIVFPVFFLLRGKHKSWIIEQIASVKKDSDARRREYIIWFWSLVPAFLRYSPVIKEIKVVSHRKVRRARLYYLRDKLPRLSTFK